MRWVCRRRGCNRTVIRPCRSHRSRACHHCAAAYRRRVTRLVSEGIHVQRQRSGWVALVTLTPPGERQHSLRGEVCRCTPDGGVDLAVWNPTAGRRWNLLRTRLAAAYPGLEYFRGVEVQKRGGIHLHLIIRSAKPIATERLRAMAMDAGFGHSVNVQVIADGSDRAARYVAKYVSKACDDREQVPWAVERVNDHTGEIVRREAVATHRNWSSSQGWGCTMREVRDAARRAREASAVVGRVVQVLDVDAREAGPEAVAAFAPAVGPPI